MTETIRSGTWLAITESIKGASHIATSKGNQDAVNVLPCSDLGLAVAVADGHGSAKYIRSDVGAKFAVEIATKEFALLLDDQRFISVDELRQRVAQGIMHRWRNAVNEHLNTRPLDDEERRRTGLSPGDDVQAYGTTLLAAGVKYARRRNSTAQGNGPEGVAYFLQIGDGDLVVVDISGNVSRPIAKERGVLGEETDSLCMKDAWKKFRGAAKRIHRDNLVEQPSLVFMTTDGYSKAFVDDQAFLQAAKDYFDLLSRPKGVLAVERNLTEWLREASDKFTGDDVTVALVSRVITAPKSRTQAHNSGGHSKANRRARK